ncbi:MAG TPA: hypothetical protein DEU95_13490 [Chloroflexi bacterium]|nr:hypothetical protein [Chloroflexota bacterium]HCG30694.1 hypothetical protein [Chloroflexota bacterium]
MCAETGPAQDADLLRIGSRLGRSFMHLRRARTASPHEYTERSRSMARRLVRRMAGGYSDDGMRAGMKVPAL